MRIALTDGQISGFVKVVDDPGADEPTELADLGVCEQWRGRGVGRALFRGALHYMTRAGTAGLRIIAHPSAAGFFTRVGPNASHPATDPPS